MNKYTIDGKLFTFRHFTSGNNILNLHFTENALLKNEVHWNEYVKRLLELPSSQNVVDVKGVCFDKGRHKTIYVLYVTLCVYAIIFYMYEITIDHTMREFNKSTSVFVDGYFCMSLIFLSIECIYLMQEHLTSDTLKDHLDYKRDERKPLNEAVRLAPETVRSILEILQGLKLIQSFGASILFESTRK